MLSEIQRSRFNHHEAPPKKLKEMGKAKSARHSLLRLGALGLVLPTSLQRIRSVLRVETVVPPPETAGIVSNELFMMKIVVVGTCPEGEEVVQTPWEFISAVGINGLEQAQHDPDVHGEDVQIAREGTPQNGATDGAKAQNHDLDWRSILRGQPEGSRVLVVDLVDGLVQRAPVQRTVGEVVPGIFHHEEDGDLVGHGPEAREGDRGGESAKLCHWVEEPALRLDGIRTALQAGLLSLPDLRQFDREMTQKHELGAVPLFLQGGHFVLRCVRKEARTGEGICGGLTP